jgi:hypothetical protein
LLDRFFHASCDRTGTGFDDCITKPVTGVKLKAQLDAAGPAVDR